MSPRAPRQADGGRAAGSGSGASRGGGSARGEARRRGTGRSGAAPGGAPRAPEGGWRLDDFDDIPMPRAASEEDGTVRLQKALANAGVASRRACEQLIAAGRVRVNGATVTELGSRVDPSRDRVVVDGRVIQFDDAKRYVILNKPTGVVSSMRDERGRPDLRRFAGEWTERVYNVGRLDAETSGLLVLTNDGELAQVLAHPSFGVEKTYVAKVRGSVSAATIQRLRDGIELDDGPISCDAAKVVASRPGRATIVEVTLHSGRNRIVRRMLDAVGHPVLELSRTAFGPLSLGSLKAGEQREATARELGELLALVDRADAADGRERA